MRQFIIILMIVAMCPVMTCAQDCNVPVSYLFRYDQNQTTESGYSGGYRGSDEGIHKWNVFVDFLKRHNLSEEMRNTRLAICHNYISTIRSLRLRVSLYDTENNAILYTVVLDTCYAEEDIFKLSLRMDEDIFSDRNTQYCSVIDTIRAKIIMLNETSTKSMLKTARNHIAEGNAEMAMFILAQYPECCPSYMRVLPFIAATFREYVKRDHAKLLRHAKFVWENHESEVDARFVVSLLNSEELSEGERKKAKKILKSVAKEYPSIDVNAHEDYCATPDLADVAVKLACQIGVKYGAMHAPETFNYIPEV